MRTIYIGDSQSSKSNNGLMTKIYLFLFLFLIVSGYALKLSAPIIVEEWINSNGGGKTGYAFSIRDADVQFSKGQLVLNDVKVFNPENSAKLIESPHLTLQVNLRDLLLSQEKVISFSADKVDVMLSKDFSSELNRIQTSSGKDGKNLFMESVDGKIGKLNIIEQKEDLSRTVIELSDANFKMKEVSLQSINKKTEFSVSSNVADGGKINLSGKTREENGNTTWVIDGSLKQVPSDIFNKMAGDKLPFSFKEPNINAEISARSEQGKVSGEITPDIKILNLIDEKPGIPTQTIARALTDELTFTLPFTLKDDLKLQYVETFRKLKTYRKDQVATNDTPAPVVPAKVTEVKKAKKEFSFWSF